MHERIFQFLFSKIIILMHIILLSKLSVHFYFFSIFRVLIIILVIIIFTCHKVDIPTYGQYYSHPKWHSKPKHSAWIFEKISRSTSLHSKNKLAPLLYNKAAYQFQNREVPEKKEQRKLYLDNSLRLIVMEPTFNMGLIIACLISNYLINHGSLITLDTVSEPRAVSKEADKPWLIKYQLIIPLLH